MSNPDFETWHGASVLPFAQTESGEIYFLLGKEKEDRSWQSTSNRWCDFGGRRCYYQDKDVFHSGSREFLEEMAGCYCGSFDLGPEELKRAEAYAAHQSEGWSRCLAASASHDAFDTNREFVEAVAREAAVLSAGRYAYLIARPSKEEGPIAKDVDAFSKAKSFVTIVKRIEFDPGLPKVFDAVIAKLQDVADCARLYAIEYCETMGKPLKKAMYSNMKVRSAVLDETGRWIGSKTSSGKPFVPRLIWKMLASSEELGLASEEACLKCENCLNKTIANVSKTDGGYDVSLTREPACSERSYGLSNSRFLTVRTTKGSRLAAFEAMVAKRSRLNEKMNALSKGLRVHPALNSCVDPYMPDEEALSFVLVRTEFLEKQKIAWWSLDRLTEVCESSDSSYKGEQFRQWAVDVLPIVLPWVEAYCKKYNH